VNRNVRIATYIAAGLATGLIIASIVLYSLSRTQFGMERVRRFALSWLEDQVEGEIHIGSFSGRGLLGGLTFHDFYIIDKKDRPFLAADSARFAYNWRTFISGRIVLDQVTLYSPKIYLEQLPGDSIWNYQHVFPDRSKPGDPPARRRLILFNNANVVNGLAVVRVPFEPGEGIEADDTARSMVEEVPGGTAKVMRFDSINGTFSRVIWESPDEQGKLVDIRSLTGKGFVWRDPFRLTALRGTVTMIDSIIAFDIPDARLQSSQASIVGRVIMEEGNNFFDIRADGKRFTFRDMQWLYPRLPDDGSGSGILRIQSQRPKGILFLATNTRIAAPGTRMSGSFGVVMGDTMYFTNVDLRAAPLNLELIQAILPGKLPVDGLLVGTVEVKGPLSALETKGDLQLAHKGEKSGVKWSGTFDVRDGMDGIDARNLRADLNKLDLAILSALRPDLRLRGHVTGSVEATGNVESVKFAADIHHYLMGYASSFDGDGVYNATGPNAGLDLRLNARPLSFEELAKAYPALERLRGDARGPIRLFGSLDDLQVEAELQTVAGMAKVNGRLQRRNGRPTYVGEAVISDFLLDKLIVDLPATSLSGTVAFDLAGNDQTAVAGRIKARLSKGKVSVVDFIDGQTALMLEHDRIRVDSAFARTPLGDVTARGLISLQDDRVDTLHFNVTSDSITYASLGARLRADGAMIGARGQFAGKVDLLATRDSNQVAARALYDLEGGGLYFRIEDMRVGSLRTPWQLVRAAHLSVNDHGLSVDTLEVRRDAGGSVQLTGRVAWHGKDHAAEAENVSDLRIDFKGVPFADFAHIVVGSMQTSGSIDGSVQIGGNSAAPIIGGAAVLQKLALGDAELDSVQSSFSYVNRQLTTRLNAHEQGRRVFFADGVIPIDLSFTPVSERRLNLPLSVSVTADSAPAVLLTGFVKGLHDVRGKIAGTVTAGGTTQKLQLGGAFEMLGGDALYEPTGVRYRNVNGTVSLEGNRTARVDASLRGNTGFARVTGTVGFANVLDPELDLTIGAEEFTASKRKDAEFTAGGEIRLRGSYRRPVISGGIAINKGALYLDEIYRRYQIVELDNPLLYDVVDTTIVALQSFLPPTQNPFIKNLVIRGLRVDVGRESWLRSRDLNVELTGELTIDFLDNDLITTQRTAGDLRMLGTLRALRGTYHLYSTGIARQFAIREGTVEFPGTPGVDPNLGFNAVYRARPSQGDPIDIVAVVGGTLRSPRVRLTSDEEPPISESDLASYLFFGLPTYALSPSQNAGVNQTIAGLDPQVMAFAGLGVRALTSSGFGYLASGLQTFAQNFGLVDYVSLTAAEASPGIAQQNALAGLFARTRLDLGWYVGDDVYVAFSQPLSFAGEGSRPGVRLEWRFLPTLTAEFFWEDRFARNPSFGIANSDSRRVGGFFLFREWSY
jgi:hypothetical protein